MSSDSDSEGSLDWDEVDVDNDTYYDDHHHNNQDGGIEITLHRAPSPKNWNAKEKKRSNIPTQAERRARIDIHRAHLMSLVASCYLRNSLLNNEILQARLMSKVPLRIQNAFHSYSVRTHPNERDRSRLFDSALRDLVHWWYLCFDIDYSLGMIYQPWARVEKEIAQYRQVFPHDPRNKGKAKEKIPVQDNKKLAIPTFRKGEQIRSAQSLMKRAVLMSGSKDMSAQLFTALCRALDIPARLVCSLQPVAWKLSADKQQQQNRSPKKLKNSEYYAPPSSSSSGSGSDEPKINIVKDGPQNKQLEQEQEVDAQENDHAENDDNNDDDDDEMIFEQVEIPSVSSGRKKQDTSSSARSRSSTPSVVILEHNETSNKRNAKSSTRIKSNNNISRNSKKSRQRLKSIKMKNKDNNNNNGNDSNMDIETDGDYDFDQDIEINERQSTPPVFWTEVYCRTSKEWITVDPIRDKIRCRNQMEPAKSSRTNKLMYIVALEEDNYIRDVTPRYAKQLGSETLKMRLPTQKGVNFYEQVLKPYIRPYRLTRDDKEDAELLSAQYREQMPTSIIGFKNHPLYALERHLKRDEVLHPQKQIGTFRGESVYPRSSVIPLKSAETYMREGRQIVSGEQPLKMVKQRAVTINKRRAQELASIEGHDEVQQGLYAHWQTELVVPEPVVNGKVPRNVYGNLDLFAPHMLPKGGAFLPYKGIGKIAKQLGVDYSEAVTGFEFKQRRAVPVISGIVVPEESRDMVVEAFVIWEQKQIEKQVAQRQERCLTKWQKLIRGLQIRERLQSSYKYLDKSASSDNSNNENNKDLRKIDRNELQNLDLDDRESSYTNKPRLKLSLKLKSTSNSPSPASASASASASEAPESNSKSSIPIPSLSEIYNIDNQSSIPSSNINNEGTIPQQQIEQSEPEPKTSRKRKTPSKNTTTHRPSKRPQRQSQRLRSRISYAEQDESDGE